MADVTVEQFTASGALPVALRHAVCASLSPLANSDCNGNFRIIQLVDTSTTLAARGLGVSIMQISYSVVFNAETDTPVPGATERLRLQNAVDSGVLPAFMLAEVKSANVIVASDVALLLRARWVTPSIAAPRSSPYLPRATPAPSAPPSFAPSPATEQPKAILAIVASVCGVAVALVLALFAERRRRHWLELAKVHPPAADKQNGPQRSAALWRMSKTHQSRAVAPAPLPPSPERERDRAFLPPPLPLPLHSMLSIVPSLGPGASPLPQRSPAVQDTFRAARARNMAKRASANARRLALSQALGRAPTATSAAEHIALQLELSSSSSSSSDDDAEVVEGWMRARDKKLAEAAAWRLDRDIAADAFALRVHHAASPVQGLRLLSAAVGGDGGAAGGPRARSYDDDEDEEESKEERAATPPTPPPPPPPPPPI